MENNKVILEDGTVLMDITDTTAEPSDVAAGEVFYTKSGARGVGTGNYMSKVDDPTSVFRVFTAFPDFTRFIACSYLATVHDKKP